MEWVIDGLALSSELFQQFTELFPQHVMITKTAREFEFFEKRKAWLVNATQLIVALLARHKGIGHMWEGLFDDEIINHVLAIQEAFGTALQYYALEKNIQIPETQLGSIRRFCRKVLDRIEDDREDRPERVLGKLVQTVEWGILGSHLKKSVERIADPLAILTTKELELWLGRKPEISRSVFRLFSEYLIFLKERAEKKKELVYTLDLIFEVLVHLISQSQEILPSDKEATVKQIKELAGNPHISKFTKADMIKELKNAKSEK